MDRCHHAAARALHPEPFIGQTDFRVRAEAEQLLAASVPVAIAPKLGAIRRDVDVEAFFVGDLAGRCARLQRPQCSIRQRHRWYRRGTADNTSISAGCERTVTHRTAHKRA